MTLGYHLLAAAGFVLAGHPDAALATLIPDVVLLPNIIRGWKRMDGIAKCSARIVQDERLHQLYRVSHSFLTWGLIAAATQSWAVLLGFTVHFLMDLAHYGRLSPAPLYPFFSCKDRLAVVPLSGGHDSVRCLAVAAGSYPLGSIRAIFIDYGQPQMIQEKSAARYAARHFGVPLEEIKIPVIDALPSGEFPDRNFKIISAAVESVYGGDIDLFIGSRTPFRCFDQYGDCAPANIRGFLRHRTVHWKRVKLCFPCMLLPSFMIRKSLERNWIDLDQLHSTKTN